MAESTEDELLENEKLAKKILGVYDHLKFNHEFGMPEIYPDTMAELAEQIDFIEDLRLDRADKYELFTVSFLKEVQHARRVKKVGPFKCKLEATHPLENTSWRRNSAFEFVHDLAFYIQEKLQIADYSQISRIVASHQKENDDDDSNYGINLALGYFCGVMSSLPTFDVDETFYELDFELNAIKQLRSSGKSFFYIPPQDHPANWSAVATKKEWARRFEVDWSTISRWQREGKIRLEIINARRVRVHNEDVAKFQKRK